MSQADLRLLLQPEELQQEQQEEHLAAAARMGGTSGSVGAAAPSSPPPSPPPSFETYLKTEALRVAHQTDLFKLCPKCGEDPSLFQFIG